MPYYRGDGFGRGGGNYYRGDPFLGGLVAGVVGGAAKRAVKWVGKRIGGTARDAAPGVIGGAVGYAAGSGMVPTISPIPTLGPEQRGPGTAIVKYVEQPKRRRMNPLNPRALRRALRRAEGFEKFAAKTVNALYRVIDGKKVRTYKRKSS